MATQRLSAKPPRSTRRAASTRQGPPPAADLRHALGPPLPATEKKLAPDRSKRIGFTQFLVDGRVVYDDLIKQMYDEAN